MKYYIRQYEKCVKRLFPFKYKLTVRKKYILTATKQYFDYFADLAEYLNGSWRTDQ